MKKILALLAAVFLAFALVGCRPSAATVRKVESVRPDETGYVFVGSEGVTVNHKTSEYIELVASAARIRKSDFKDGTRILRTWNSDREAFFELRSFKKWYGDGFLFARVDLRSGKAKILKTWNRKSPDGVTVRRGEGEVFYLQFSDRVEVISGDGAVKVYDPDDETIDLSQYPLAKNEDPIPNASVPNSITVFGRTFSIERISDKSGIRTAGLEFSDEATGASWQIDRERVLANYKIKQVMENFSESTLTVCNVTVQNGELYLIFGTRPWTPPIIIKWDFEKDDLVYLGCHTICNEFSLRILK